MLPIKFKSYFDYMSNILINTTKELYDNDEIDKNYSYTIYSNSGDYFKTDKKEYLETEKQPDEIIVNISDDGGAQDSSVPIDTFLQLVKIEILAYENMRDDIITILTKIATDNKSKIDNLKYEIPIFDSEGNEITKETKKSAIQITVDDLPEFSEIQNIQGEDKFVSSLEINFIIFPDAKLSNNYKFYIDGNEVKYTNIILSRNTETTADLQKRTTLLFYPNTTGFQIQVSGLYVENPSLNTLLEDCSNNTKFNQTYNISLEKPNGNGYIINNKFYCVDSRFDLKWGSVVNFQATFYLAIEEL